MKEIKIQRDYLINEQRLKSVLTATPDLLRIDFVITSEKQIDPSYTAYIFNLMSQIICKAEGIEAEDFNVGDGDAGNLH